MPRLQSVERHAFDLLVDLCSTPSVSGEEASLLPVLSAELRRLGASFRVQELPGGGVNLLASWGNPVLVYSTHLDTVPADFLPRVEPGLLRARGACDAKGQVAAQLAAIELLLEAGIRDLAWYGLGREETDSAGVAAFAGTPEAADMARMCALLVNGEPTGNRLATGQKGCLVARLECRGKSAHGSMPELGRNAIVDLVSWLDRITSAETAEHPLLGREVCNPGLIAGGSAANVVPEYAGAELSLRLVPGGTLRRLLESTRPDNGSVETVVDDPHKFFDVPDGFAACTVPFGSDLPALHKLAPAAKAVLAGPGRIETAHGPDEQLSSAELSEGISLFFSLGLHVAGGSTDLKRSAGWN